MENQYLKPFSSYPFIFGGASISGDGGGYGFGEISEQKATDLLKLSFDHNIRVFDTAPIYGFGKSEERIGKAFKSSRDKVFIISKAGVTWHSTKRVNMSNDPKVIDQMLHDSLKRLQTDYIDLYMIHWPDEKVDIRHSLEVLAKAKEQHKIKHIGLCNTNEEELKKAFEVERIDFVQSEFNIFNQAPLESIKDVLKEHNIGFMSWGTLDKGIITKRAKEKRTYDACDARSWAPWWKKVNKDEKYKKIEKLENKLKSINLTLLDLALHFNLSHPQLDAVLSGPRNEMQFLEIIESLNKKIDPNFINEVLCD